MQAQEIRPAATLLLLRDRKSGGPWEVFITRRPDTMKFLPGYFVYPGGALEEGDYGEEIFSHCATAAWETRDELAHKVAAIRECYEEAGILFARDEEGRWTNKNQWSTWQSLLRKKESFHAWVCKNRWVLATDQLMYIGCRVTPKNPSGRRFRTRFYMTLLPSGMEPQVNAEEVQEGLWLTGEEALSANARGEMPMALPTLDSLRHLSRFSCTETILQQTERDFVQPLRQG